MLSVKKPSTKLREIANRLHNPSDPHLYIVYINMRILSYFNNQFGGTPEYENLKKSRYFAEEHILKLKTQSEKHKTKKGIKPLSKSTKKITQGVIAGGAAICAGGYAAGAVSKAIAPATESLVKFSVNKAFGTLSGGFVVDNLSNILGSTSSKLVAGALPIPLLYVSILEMSKLFFFGLKKAQKFFKKTFGSANEDLDFIPDSGPILALICNFSVLTILNELDIEQKLNNLQIIKINFLNLFENIKNSGDNKKLSRQDLLLRNIVANKINQIKEIALKARSSEDALKEYTKLKASINFVEHVEPYAKAGIDKDMFFWLSVFGKLTTLQTNYMQSFLCNTFKTILVDPTYDSISIYDGHNYENLDNVDLILTQTSTQQLLPSTSPKQLDPQESYSSSISSTHTYFEIQEPSFAPLPHKYFANKEFSYIKSEGHRVSDNYTKNFVFTHPKDHVNPQFSSASNSRSQLNHSLRNDFYPKENKSHHSDSSSMHTYFDIQRQPSRHVLPNESMNEHHVYKNSDDAPDNPEHHIYEEIDEIYDTYSVSKATAPNTASPITSHICSIRNTQPSYTYFTDYAKKDSLSAKHKNTYVSKNNSS